MFDGLHIKQIQPDFWHITITRGNEIRSYHGNTETMAIFVGEAMNVVKEHLPKERANECE